jgi:hypothetical protein
MSLRKRKRRTPNKSGMPTTYSARATVAIGTRALHSVSLPSKRKRKREKGM